MGCRGCAESLEHQGADITNGGDSLEQRQKENEKILMEIKESHKNSRRAYGSPRITEDFTGKGNEMWRN